MTTMRRFDGVLVDAPCTATGTIRRHPDIAWLKSEADIGTLAAAQRKLLRRGDRRCSNRAARWSIAPARSSRRKASGRSRTCSRASVDLRRAPVEAGEVGGLNELISPAGDLRTLPCHLPAADPRLGGMDGFYAARLVKP